jgi:stage II sporulation protein D
MSHHRTSARRPAGVPAGLTARLTAGSAGWLVAGLVAALCVVGAPAARAAQGEGPTTAITGPLDSSSSAPPPGFQQGCLPAGGQAIPDPELPESDFVIVGGGWGHGAGMSQYGAQGAGRLGCSAEQILTSYFPGTEMGSRPMPSRVVIGLASSLTATAVTASAGPIPWRLCHYQTGECDPLPVEQPTGAVWQVTIRSDATYAVTQGDQLIWEGGSFELNLQALLTPGEGAVDRRALLGHTGHTYRWGVLQFDSVARAPADAVVTVEIPSMALYLRGLAEVPASWPDATLRAQAISGRSYAMRKIAAAEALPGGLMDKACRCHLVDTPADQNYEGYDHERADAQGGGSWRAAVEATDGQVLLYEGQIAETFYSSSHGGHSESSAFVFGGALPYVQPVDDSRWDLASSNPLRRWAAGFSAADLGGATGVGTATALELLEPRGAAGRVGDPARGYGGVRVTGTGGQVVLSGNALRQRLGLRSTLFDVRAGGAPPTEPPSEPPPSEPPPSEPPTSEPPPPSAADLLDRAAGDNRITTALAVSAEAWDGAPDVVIAAADRFPDALAGVRLAASLEAPLLLSHRDALPGEVADELRRLGTTTAWLLGGTGALGTPVRGALADMGIITRRLAGGDRYATAGAIAVAGGTSDEVVVTLGEDWPDAVSASSLAALVDGPPTLLVQRTVVPEATVQAIRDLGATRATVVGGTAVVAEAVVDELEQLGLQVTRLAGPTRYATAAAVATAALQRRTGTVPLVVASGTGFADALPAGALAARLGGVLVLAPLRALDDGPATRDFAAANRGRLDGGVVVGGTAAISARVETELEDVLDG